MLRLLHTLSPPTLCTCATRRYENDNPLLTIYRCIHHIPLPALIVLQEQYTFFLGRTNSKHSQQITQSQTSQSSPTDSHNNINTNTNTNTPHSAPASSTPASTVPSTHVHIYVDSVRCKSLVSREHIKVQYNSTKQKYVIYDLDSLNGLLMIRNNELGKRVKEWELEDGDIVVIGGGGKHITMGSSIVENRKIKSDVCYQFYSDMSHLPPLTRSSATSSSSSTHLHDSLALRDRITSILSDNHSMSNPISMHHKRRHSETETSITNSITPTDKRIRLSDSSSSSSAPRQSLTAWMAENNDHTSRTDSSLVRSTSSFLPNSLVIPERTKVSLAQQLEAQDHNTQEQHDSQMDKEHKTDDEPIDEKEKEKQQARNAQLLSKFG